jgi:hypothetical protein
VIGFRLVDGLVAASCKQSVIEQQVMDGFLGWG